MKNDPQHVVGVTLKIYSLRSQKFVYTPNCLDCTYTLGHGYDGWNIRKLQCIYKKNIYLYI